MITSLIKSQFSPLIQSMFGGDVSADPIPNWIVRYAMDGNDTNLVPIMSPTIVTGLDLPDLKASELNGVDQYFTANADSAAIATIGNGPFTIVFRIKTAIENARSIIEFGDNNGPDGWKVNVRGVGGLTFNTQGTPLNLLDDRFLDDIWLHVAITGTGSEGTLTFFINGIEEQTRTLPVYNFIDDNDFKIGENGLPSILDEFIFYTSVLPTSEIITLYNNKV